MISDRELLELTAKAASLNLRDKWAYDETWGLKVSSGPPPYEWWNPLTDDGDALRLAATFRINIRFNVSAHPDLVEVEIENGKGRSTIFAVAGVDKAAAARHAIVRAVAEIGKAMP